jgi:hypothetical protein
VVQTSGGSRHCAKVAFRFCMADLAINEVAEPEHPETFLNLAQPHCQVTELKPGRRLAGAVADLLSHRQRALELLARRRVGALVEVDRRQPV